MGVPSPLPLPLELYHWDSVLILYTLNMSINMFVFSKDLFSQFCNSQRFLDRKRLKLFLQEMLQVLGWFQGVLQNLAGLIYAKGT